MNPLEMMKKAMAEKAAKKGKKPVKKVAPKEGTAAEEAGETPEEEMAEATAGKGDKEDLYKGKK